MADPLSICSATLGIIDASVRLSLRIRGVIQLWKNAPSDILALQAELSDLLVVMDHTRVAIQDMYSAVVVQATYGRTSASPSTCASLKIELSKMENLLGELNMFVSRLLTMGNIRKRLSWVKSSSDFARDKKDQLQEVRLRVNEIFTAHIVSTGGRIELEVISLRSETNSHMENTTSRLDYLQKQLVNVTNMLEAPTPVNEAQVGISREIQEARHRVDGSEADGRRWRHMERQMPKSRLARYDTAGRTFSSSCSFSCRCQCHSVAHRLLRWELPSILRRVLGKLFIQYTGSPMSPKGICNSAQCLSPSNKPIYVDIHYSFPPWILPYAVNLILHKQATQLPTVMLSLRHRTDHQVAGVIYAAVLNNVTILESTFKTHPSAINAVDIPFGRSPLWHALSRGHIESTTFLLRAGASLDIQDDNGTSAGMCLARSILTNSFPSTKHQQLCDLIPVQKYIDELDLSPLADLAINSNATDESNAMMTLIKAYPWLRSEINAPDRLGQTPLHWAVRCNNQQRTEELLLLGADPNARDNEDRSPLHCSLLSGIDPCIFKLLTHYGAISPVVKESYAKGGISPFHIACTNGRADAVVPLLEYGEDVDRLYPDWGVTALHLATWNYHTETVCTLLANGADAFVQNKAGDSPLHVAVSHNSHECLGAFLDHLGSLRKDSKDTSAWEEADAGMRFKFRKRQEQTILHHAARVGDAGTLRILTERMAITRFLLDIDARNAERLTAEEVFAQRQAKSPGTDEDVRGAFEALVEALRWEKEEEEDEFHDALMHLEM